jgi:hypothetical protein
LGFGQSLYDIGISADDGRDAFFDRQSYLYEKSVA